MNVRDHWDKELENGMPDCRLTGHNRVRQTVYLGRMEMEKVYCANCGADGGLCTAEWTPHIFYICTPCARKLGPVANLMEIPEEVVRGKQVKPELRPVLQIYTDHLFNKK